jgi:branched-chain amino acid aminotransferase
MIQFAGDHFLNGDKTISVSHIDQYIRDEDDVVYEVIRFIDAKPLFLEDHLNRFLSTFQFNSEEIDHYKRLLTSNIHTLIKSNKKNDGNIRFQFNNKDTKSFFAWLIPFKYPTTKQYDDGIIVETYKGERNEPQIKARDLKLRQGADEFIEKHNIFEAIFVSKEGEITEGSRSNVFFLQHEKIITPPLPVVLPGITRHKIVQLIHEYGFQFEERTIYLNELKKITSCFISGTSPKILPIKIFDKKYMDIKNPLLQKLMKLYDRKIEEYLANFNWH